MAYAFGKNGAVVNAGWTSATSTLPTNPSEDFFVAFDFVRTLDRLTPFAGVLHQNAHDHSGSGFTGTGVQLQSTSIV